MTSTVNFRINGKQFSVSGDQNSKISPKSVLVDFIRDETHLKGTKYMCREGGCGACLVTAKSKDPVTGQSIVRAINSCLTPVLSCDGFDIFTIESLGNKKYGYHEIQKRLTTFSGSQCGYCTPGMIMNMYSLTNSKSNLTAKEIEDSFDGNICRCTGYRPIMDAFKSMATDAPEELRQRCVDIEDCINHHLTCQLQRKLLSKEINQANGSDNLLSQNHFSIHLNLQSGDQWIKPYDFNSLFQTIQRFQSEKLTFTLVGGNTASGIYKEDGPYSIYIDITGIPELRTNTSTDSGIIIGGGISIAIAIETLKKISNQVGYEYLAAVSSHLERVANVPVRNIGTMAGNIMIKHAHKEFPSDIFLLMESIGAKLNIASAPSLQRKYSLSEFLELDMVGKVILSFILPPLPASAGYHFRSFKISKRYQNSHAYVNAAYLFKLDLNNFNVLAKPSICYGGINPSFVHAIETEKYFIGKSLTDQKIFQDALVILNNEIKPDDSPRDATPTYRKSLTQSLLYKTIIEILGSKVKPVVVSGGNNIEHLVTSGKQTYDVDQTDWPLNKPVPKLESFIQCSGEAEYVNDIQSQPNELAAALVLTTVGNANLKGIDYLDALKVPGFVKLLQAKDIPGPNNYMVFYDEPEEIMVKDKVKAAGQVACIVIATSRDSALLAAKKVKLLYENIMKPILTIPDAISKQKEKGKEKEMHTSTSDVMKSTSVLNNTIKGEIKIGGQYHFHMETQVTLCVPKEDGMDIFASTQWVDHVQGAVASVLGIPNNKINIMVRRLGGAYGAKISRATHVAVLCALASDAVNKPVRLVLTLEENMNIIGKRLPYFASYEVGFDNNGKIEHLNCKIRCDGGLGSNENTSTFAMACLQSGYDSTGWTIDAGCVNTNTVANTYCRSPGSTQGIAIIETIMEHIAVHLKKDPLEVRLNNFIKSSEQLSSEPSPPSTDIGLNDEGNYLLKMIEEIKVSGQYEERKKFITDFNKSNRWKKRGMAMTPVKYPVEYFSTNYPCFLTIYHEDGTVAVSHGGIEMGQGINTKVAQVVAHSLQIPLQTVTVKPSNNLVGPNAESTGGSITSEMTCFAAMQACKIINERMLPIKENMNDPTWAELVEASFKEGIDLRAQYWPSKNDKLKSYNVYCLNLTEVEIDVLTGEYKIVRVDMIEDAGKSMSQEIDIGQVEGATIMGLGLWTTEKLKYDENTGQLLTNNTWNYKVPLHKDIPEDFRITLLQNAPNPFGILRAKATGEPPLTAAVCILFAMRNAIDSARLDAGNTDYYQIDGPITPEDIMRLSLVTKEMFII